MSVPVQEGTRPQAVGKFLYVGDEKFYIRGVTYGPFRPNEKGEHYDPHTASRDFARMAAEGINTVRTYTTPPRWMMDVAQEHGLRVLVGLSWEQHITFLDDRKRVRGILETVQSAARSCAKHPALLGFTIGNEIPAPIVRWYGPARIERFLKELYVTTKWQDPEALVTYVNYPTTEYLQLPFLDLMSFNVYLEAKFTLEGYLARLQNIAGEKPLLMAEIGLDSRRNGLEKQAEVVDWQVRSAFRAGCAGAFVFSWTDEWYRGGYDIEDWDFGLTDRERRPKPALEAASRAFSETPFPVNGDLPMVSVVVCTYNGGRTIRRCCEALARLDYPKYEVLVIDDGSTDKTPEILKNFDFRIVRQQNQGLSVARNTGLAKARGEIVAYIDDDAFPDPHWLQYLATSFLESGCAGVGGPNIPPRDSGFVDKSVAHAPGGPTHVLLSDEEAEHIPGCNMAFRKSALEEIGGFDPQFRTAGDDVDVCWRLQKNGHRLGFSHGAVVWHYRRNSVKGYLKQQLSYGRAEASLEVKWPDKYNVYGHVSWGGRLYTNGANLPPFLRRWRVYHGVWGSGLFQSLYVKPPGLWHCLATMPEAYLLILSLFFISLAGLVWKPLLLALPLLVAGLAVPSVHAALSARHAPLPLNGWSGSKRIRWRALTAFLSLLQPVVRLMGRISGGLTPWRGWRLRQYALPRRWECRFWSESWRSAYDRLVDLEESIWRCGAKSIRGAEHHRYDLEVSDGILGGVRLLMTIEEHGGGKQLVRFRCWPKATVPGASMVALFSGLGVLAGAFQNWGGLIILGGIALVTGIGVLVDCAAATSACLRALRMSNQGDE